MQGSLINQIMAPASASELPKVDDGVTLCFYSDRKAGTVIEVSETRIRVQEDKAVRTDKLGMTDSGQEYEFSRDPEGTVYIFTKRSDGRFWQMGHKIGTGTKLVLGGRSAYHDYSF